MNTDTTKRYRLIKELFNWTTGHIVPVGELFEQIPNTQKCYNKKGWFVSKDACLNKDYFEEVLPVSEPVKIDMALLRIAKSAFDLSGADVTMDEVINLAFAKGKSKQPTPSAPINNKEDKEWEIVYYINPNTITDVIDGNIEKPSPYAVLKNYPIHSVRRLSDGEVFTIGNETDKGKITKFYRNEVGTLLVYYEKDGLDKGWDYLRIFKKISTPNQPVTNNDDVAVLSICEIQTVLGKRIDKEDKIRLQIFLKNKLKSLNIIQ